MVQIARHQVGASQVDLFLTAVLEIIDAAVFQEAADNARHLDILADTRNSRPERAHAADQQPNAHTGL